MTICEASDIANVPFPKPRPALARWAADANEASGNTIFAMITTASRSHRPHDVVLAAAAACGLRVASLVRVKLFTLDNRLVSRRIGTLSGRDRVSVRRVLRQLIAV